VAVIKIFLLDDSMRRLQRFRRAFQSHLLTHSASASEAIELLAKEKFDLICLDHDLHEHDNDWIASGTGYEVAEFLGNNRTPNDQTRIVVHTMNPAGGDRMMAVLKDRRARRLSIIDVLSPAIVRTLIEEN
jgi:CheY-like chemotaxis protein